MLEQGPREVRKSLSLGVFKTVFPEQPDLTFKLPLLGAQDPVTDDPQRSSEPKIFCHSVELQNM